MVSWTTWRNGYRHMAVHNQSSQESFSTPVVSRRNPALAGSQKPRMAERRDLELRERARRESAAGSTPRRPSRMMARAWCRESSHISFRAVFQPMRHSKQSVRRETIVKGTVQCVSFDHFRICTLAGSESQRESRCSHTTAQRGRRRADRLGVAAHRVRSLSAFRAM